MSLSRLPFLLPMTALVALIGAGCLDAPTVPKTAEVLQTKTIDTTIARKQGFGILPRLPASSHTGTVQLAAPLPNLPSTVTVLRLKNGTPNDTELRNLANSLDISDAFIGNLPTIKDLTMQWKDDRGFTWSYTGSGRTLEGKDQTAPTEPVTLATLPPAAAILTAASSFLSDRGLDLTHNRNPLLAPDWSTWWANAQAAGQCVDRPTLSSIRFAAASAPTLIPNPPALPQASQTACVAPEFPTRVRVIYPAFIDDRDVIQLDGTPVNAAELIVDASRMSVISARITPYAIPDRSDYPALSVAQVTSLLQQGGVMGLSGAITITSYDFANLQTVDAVNDPHPRYLYPSLVAHGTRTRSDQTTEPVTLIVPLVAFP